jgi:tetratricopeptide (TPR) repeat protein
MTISQTPKWKPKSIHFEVLICLLLAAAIFIVYWQVIGFDFINYDDPDYIINNHPIEHGINFESIKWSFSTIGYTSYWHPITWISHMLDIQLFGMNPGMHHFTNVIIHILNSILLFVVLEKMTGALWKSAVVAALFALHPLHVESVAWIAERKDVLSTFFWMLTMLSYYWYVQHQTSRRYVIVVLIYILGLLSKPMIVTLPFVLFLMDFWPLKRWGFDEPLHTNTKREGKIHTDGWRLRLSFLIIEKIPFIMLAFISSGVTFYGVKSIGAMSVLKEVQFGTRLSNAITSYVIYLQNMIWPFDLSIFYPYPDFIDPLKVILSIMFLVLITSLALCFMKKLPYLLTGWLWYLGILIPVIGIVQVGIQSLADRYTYVSLIGIFIALVWGFSDFLNRFRHGSAIGSIIAAVILSLLMFITWKQISYWKNSEVIFRHATLVTTNNFLAHDKLGEALLDRDVIGAINEYQKSIEIKPHYLFAHYHLGQAYALEKKYDEAGFHYRECLKVNPDFYMACNGLGDIMLLNGKDDEAIGYYTKSLQINPYQEIVYNQLGSAYYQKRKIKKAIECFQEALRLKPDYAIVQDNLKTVKIAQSEIESSIAKVKLLLETQQRNPELYTELGDIYRQLGKYDEAIIQYKKAVSIEPKFMKAMYGLVLLYSDRQEYIKTLDVLQDMRKIEPENPTIYYNIACMYAKQNNVDKSVAWLKRSIEKGFNNWDLIKTDPDLVNIRKTSFIEELINSH